MTRPSLRAAIDAMCKNCIYDPISPGTWREQVEGCSSSNCPLHAVRPIPIAAAKERAAEQRQEQAEPPCAADDLFLARDGTKPTR